MLSDYHKYLNHQKTIKSWTWRNACSTRIRTILRSLTTVDLTSTEAAERTRSTKNQEDSVRRNCTIGRLIWNMKEMVCSRPNKNRLTMLLKNSNKILNNSENKSWIMSIPPWMKPKIVSSMRSSRDCQWIPMRKSESGNRSMNSWISSILILLVSKKVDPILSRSLQRVHL